MTPETVTVEERLARIEERLESVVTRLEAVTSRLDALAEQEHGRQASAQDLANGLRPVARELYAAVAEELADMQDVLNQEEVITLLRRLAWNVHNLNRLLEALESLADLADALAPVWRDMYHRVEHLAEEADRRGYVPFLVELGYVADRIITGFTPEDVRQLGDHVVLILNTVKQLTQPQMMHLLNNLTHSLQVAEQEAEAMPTDLRSLVRLMRDPQVRRGLAVVLATLRGMAPEAEQTEQDGGKGR